MSRPSHQAPSCAATRTRPTGRAFTLLEVLVALAVFAAIGVMSSRILSGMVDVAETMHSRSDSFADLQRALFIVQRDVEQLVHRSVRDELGDARAAASVGDGSLLEITRLGWQNPLAAARSELQRVAYVFEDGRLIRLFWDVLDRAPSSEPVAQALLAEVDEAEFVAYDDRGQEHRFWPRSSIDTKQQLAAIGLRLDTATYGRIERLLLVPAPATDLVEPEDDEDDLDDDLNDDLEDESPAPNERPVQPEAMEISAALGRGKRGGQGA